LATQAAAAEKFASAGAWVSHLVLAETLWVLASLYDRNAASLADVVRRLHRTTCNAKELFVASTVLFV
jgi:hypothetical protein